MLNSMNTFPSHMSDMQQAEYQRREHTTPFVHFILFLPQFTKTNLFSRKIKNKIEKTKNSRILLSWIKLLPFKYLHSYKIQIFLPSFQLVDILL